MVRTKRVPLGLPVRRVSAYPAYGGATPILFTRPWSCSRRPHGELGIGYAGWVLMRVGGARIVRTLTTTGEAVRPASSPGHGQT